MSLDHFVSQVHLKNFISPKLGNRLYAIRKSDTARFTPRAKDVCRIEDGSTNAYLQQERAVEEFLKAIEPKYNTALAAVRKGEIDQEAVLVIAGFASFVTCCSPAAMRIGSGPLKALVEVEAALLDRQGLIDRAPPSLGEKTLTELLSEGSVRVSIDRKFPQALGVTSILSRASIWGNSPWEILHNHDSSSSFFTSDFPVAIEQRPDGILNRIVPLAPDLAVRIIPDVRLSRSKPDISFAKFRYRRCTLNRRMTIHVNRLIVQCAEDLVFFRDDHEWISRFVAKYRHYRVDSITSRVPQGSGFMTHASERIVEKRAA
jgi:Protein of unknown function (DUF4238)